jgi:TRAP-type C4-dicarboxylate transport system substrate-binding protein
MASEGYCFRDSMSRDSLFKYEKHTVIVGSVSDQTKERRDEMRNRRIALVTGLLVAFVLVMGPIIAQAQTSSPSVIHWKGQCAYASTVAPFGPFGRGYAGIYAHFWWWAEWVKKASGGRLVIDLVEPGAVFPIGEADLAVGKSVVQVAIGMGSYFGGRMPETDVEGGGVFQWENNEQNYECITKYGLGKALQKVYAKRNLMWLPGYAGAIIGVGTNFPAPNPAALKGKKLRTTGMWADYIRMLGGSPVNLPWGEMYMAMKLGTIDGYVAGPGVFEDLKMKEVTKGFVYPPLISTSPSGIIINMHAFKALPPDLQELLERDSGYVIYAGSHNLHNQQDWILKMAAQQYGVKIYTWSPEEIQQITQQVVEEIYPRTAARSKDCAELVEIVKKQMRDYGRIK